MTPRWRTTPGGGGAPAVLLVMLLPAACLQTVVLDHPASGGTGGNPANPDGATVDRVALSDGGPGGTGGPGGPGGTGGRLVCANGAAPIQINAQRPSVTIALDHTSSMFSMDNHFGSGNGSRIASAQDQIRKMLLDYSSVIQFGYIEFPGVPPNGSCASPMGCCAGVVISPIRSGRQLNGINDALNQCSNPPQVSGCINTDWTPTAQAVSRINDDYGTNNANGMSSSNDNGLRYALLMTDGEPSCPSPFSTMGRSLCDQAKAEIVNAQNVTEVSTFIVGIGDIPGPPDSAGFNGCLDSLALAGGVSHAPAPYYYAAANDTALHEQLVAIATQVICHLQIDSVNFDPDQPIELVISGNPVNLILPRDQFPPSNGWAFDHGMTNRITVAGEPCTKTLLPSVLATGSLQKVHVSACPVWGMH